MEKLRKIQSELKAPKNQYNTFGKYNYRNCEDILEAVKPLLEKYECSMVITDDVKEISGMLFVEATVKFTDDKASLLQQSCLEVKSQAGITERKGMDLAQSFGASSSYARKYALNGLFLIDDTKDPDSREPNEITKKEKPWLTKELLDKAKAKIISGEEDVIKNLDQHYKMKKIYRAELEQLEGDVAENNFEKQFDEE